MTFDNNIYGIKMLADTVNEDISINGVASYAEGEKTVPLYAIETSEDPATGEKIAVGETPYQDAYEECFLVYESNVSSLEWDKETRILRRKE